MRKLPGPEPIDLSNKVPSTNKMPTNTSPLFFHTSQAVVPMLMPTTETSKGEDAIDASFSCIFQHLQSSPSPNLSHSLGHTTTNPHHAITEPIENPSLSLTNPCTNQHLGQADSTSNQCAQPLQTQTVPRAYPMKTCTMKNIFKPKQLHIVSKHPLPQTIELTCVSQADSQL